MKDLFSLEGKIALKVTGGSTGIGAMIAEGFCQFWGEGTSSRVKKRR